MHYTSVVLHPVWNLICSVGAALAAKLTVKFSTPFAAKAAPTRDLLTFTLSLVNNATLH
jgi:hypothetical protein